MFRNVTNSKQKEVLLNNHLYLYTFSFDSRQGQDDPIKHNNYYIIIIKKQFRSVTIC